MSTVLAACSDGKTSNTKLGDGGVRGGSGKGGANQGDGGTKQGTGGSGATHAGSLGSACKDDTDCGKLVCDKELDVSFPATGLPAGETEVKSKSFPGGSCTPKRAAAYDPNGVTSCDPSMPQAQQGCGTDGSCVPVLTDTQTVVACRPSCDPADNAACGRTGYTCDFSFKACMEGCQSDEECRLEFADTDGDGQADQATYDATSKAVCDTQSFRCVLKSAGGGTTGAACTHLDDCEAEGICFDPLTDYGRISFPGGYCSKYGCDYAGRECQGQDAVCTELRTWDPTSGSFGNACFQSCKIGAEAAADRVGPKGHGDGCREGYRCHYNGVSGARAGVCVGGNYNAVTSENLGAACKTDDECYSPYGLGNCIALSVGSVAAKTGFCTIMDCNVPGLPDDVCGSSGQCVGLSGDVTFCVKSCTDASECASGLGCTDDDQDPSTSKVCYPVCTGDADCAKGERCAPASSSSSVGTCVAAR